MPGPALRIVAELVPSASGRIPCWATAFPTGPFVLPFFFSKIPVDNATQPEPSSPHPEGLGRVPCAGSGPAGGTPKAGPRQPETLDDSYHPPGTGFRLTESGLPQRLGSSHRPRVGLCAPSVTQGRKEAGDETN